MRISAKGRYALAAMIHLAQKYETGKHTTVISISELLGISKIYLEQVFSLLKRGEIVRSIKGAQGGYSLTENPNQITVFRVLFAVEASLFEDTQPTVAGKAPGIEAAMRNVAFDAIDDAIEKTLSSVTLMDLAVEADKNQSQEYMFFI